MYIPWSFSRERSLEPSRLVKPPRIWQPNQFIRLKPEEMYTKRLACLLEEYPVGRFVITLTYDPMLQYPAFEHEKTKVQAQFFGDRIWNGRAFSNPLTIEVAYSPAAQGAIGAAMTFWQQRYGVGPGDFTMGPPTTKDMGRAWRITAVTPTHTMPPLEVEVDKRTGQIHDVPRE